MKDVSVFEYVNHRQLEDEITALLYALWIRSSLKDGSPITISRGDISRVRERTFERLCDKAGNVHYVIIEREDS